MFCNERHLALTLALGAVHLQMIPCLYTDLLRQRAGLGPPVKIIQGNRTSEKRTASLERTDQN